MGLKPSGWVSSWWWLLMLVVLLLLLRPPLLLGVGHQPGMAGWMCGWVRRSVEFRGEHSMVDCVFCTLQNGVHLHKWRAFTLTNIQSHPPKIKEICVYSFIYTWNRKD